MAEKLLEIFVDHIRERSPAILELYPCQIIRIGKNWTFSRSKVRPVLLPQRSIEQWLKFIWDGDGQILGSSFGLLRVFRKLIVCERLLISSPKLDGVCV